MAKKQGGVYIDENIWKQIEDIAQREKRSMNQVIEIILSDYLSSHKGKPLLK